MNATMIAGKRPKLRKPWNSLSRQLLRNWYFFAWLAAAGAAAWFCLRDPVTGTGFPAIVESDPVTLAPVETAVLQRVLVREGQAVRAGEVLAEMDAGLVAQGVTADIIDTVRIATSFGDTHQDVLQAVSQRVDEMARLEAQLAANALEWRAAEGELRGLQAEQQRREALYAQRIIDSLAAHELQPQIAALEAAVKVYPTVNATYQRQLDAASNHYDTIVQWLDVRGDESVSAAIRRHTNEDEGQRLLTEAAEQARDYLEQYKLRAPYDGLVSAVIRRPGDTVPAGMPIIRVVRANPTHLRAYIPEQFASQFAVGDSVRVSAAFRPKCHITAQVENLSSEIWPASADLSMTGRPIPVRSRIALLRFASSEPLLAGEVVYVSRLRPTLIAALARIGASP